MHKRPTFLRGFAVAATYVVVLQMLLLPLSVAASAAVALPGQLCSELGSGQPDKAHTGPCACASGCGMPCCDPAGSNPPAAAAVLDRKPLGVLTPLPARDAFIFAGECSPHNPRAPPSVAI